MDATKRKKRDPLIIVLHFISFQEKECSTNARTKRPLFACECMCVLYAKKDVNLYVEINPKSQIDLAGKFLDYDIKT